MNEENKVLIIRQLDILQNKLPLYKSNLRSLKRMKTKHISSKNGVSMAELETINISILNEYKTAMQFILDIMSGEANWIDLGNGIYIGIIGDSVILNPSNNINDIMISEGMIDQSQYTIYKTL
ncbi:MAG: hypothetical protein IPO72_00640 [Saprospiraceae bacterium]|nr:hypothetical protein [Candidatus Vicinibacter affinis]MBP7305882.1 hypothetical protein [Saprospiraceae bacterium]MBK6571535.1 hypothetical protein [Candidatus Vicinibacter affinis]MBK6821808.1 hypothetical protein [Candidatus Vicinibacter affinis]MBK7697062.1 hypothetical protein [Candidatus Vicinibacter affinis]